MRSFAFYDDNSNFIYKWIVNRETMGKKALADWTVSQGITEDKESGTLSLDTSVEQFGKFSIVVPVGSDSSDDSADDSDDTDDTDNAVMRIYLMTVIMMIMMPA